MQVSVKNFQFFADSLLVFCQSHKIPYPDHFRTRNVNNMVIVDLQDDFVSALKENPEKFLLFKSWLSDF